MLAQTHIKINNSTKIIIAVSPIKIYNIFTDDFGYASAIFRQF